MITDKQREQRRKHIGASDAAAILGLDEFRTAGSVWYEKIVGVEDKTSPAAEVGNRLEPFLLDWCADELGVHVEPDVRFETRDGLIAANLDGWIDEDGRREVVEAKSTGLAGNWGREGTDEVPYRVLVQCMVQMLCARATVAWVPVLIGSFGLRLQLHRVPFDASLAEEIAERLHEWWWRYVETQTAPPDAPSLDIAKRLRRQPNAECGVGDELIEEWLYERTQRKAAQCREDEAQAELLAAMLHHEAAHSEHAGRVTYFEQSKTSIDMAKLRRLYPDAFSECSKQTRYRVLRHKR